MREIAARVPVMVVRRGAVAIPGDYRLPVNRYPPTIMVHAPWDASPARSVPTFDPSSDKIISMRNRTGSLAFRPSALRWALGRQGLFSVL